MKIKTSELKGLALDYAVAICEYPKLVYGETIGEHYASRQIVIPEFKEPDCYYAPSVKWELAGPIIEREKIAIMCPSTGDFWDARANVFPAEYWRGETPLIAAMRCYVASKLGDEVEIPKELVG